MRIFLEEQEKKRGEPVEIAYLHIELERLADKHGSTAENMIRVDCLGNSSYKAKEIIFLNIQKSEKKPS